MKTLTYSRSRLMHKIGEIRPIDTAIEVGTWRGDFAAEMINALKPTTFFAVDPLRIMPGLTSNPGDEFDSQDKLDRLASEVTKRLQDQGHSLIRETSAVAATQFKDNSLDLVYIDGDHSYENCSSDISDWYPKVKENGILCGHDYCWGHKGRNIPFGVIQAVTELIEKHNLNLYITNEEFASWLIVKGNTEISL